MFGKKKHAPLDAVPPNGVFVRDPQGAAWFIKGGKLKVSEIHLSSWSVDPIPVTATSLLHLPEIGKIGFRDGTLCRDFGDGRIYLISDQKRRQVRNPSTYESLGGDRKCMSVPTEYIRVHELGEPLD
jgi:hypothetical protein